MLKIKSTLFGAAFSFGALAAGTALAQEAGFVTVDLSGVSADIGAQLETDADGLPGTIVLSAEAAADACGLELAELEDSCTAIHVTEALTAAVEDSLEDDDNSARIYAPGQQDGPARDFAPGQQDGPAKDSAPGQQKKDD